MNNTVMFMLKIGCPFVPNYCISVTQYFMTLAYIYIIINASHEGTCICVKFELKTTQHWFSYFQIACKYFFMTDPLNIIFDDFGM